MAGVQGSGGLRHQLTPPIHRFRHPAERCRRTELFRKAIFSDNATSMYLQDSAAFMPFLIRPPIKLAARHGASWFTPSRQVATPSAQALPSLRSDLLSLKLHNIIERANASHCCKAQLQHCIYCVFYILSKAKRDHLVTRRHPPGLAANRILHTSESFKTAKP